MQMDTDCAVMRRCTAAIAANASDQKVVDNYWSQFEKAYDSAVTNVDRYLANNDSDTVRDAATLKSNNEILSALKIRLGQYLVAAEKGVVLARSTGDTVATNTVFLDAAPIMAEVADTVESLVPKAAAYIDEVSAANTQSKVSSVLMLLLLVLVIAALSVVIALYVSGLISKPLLKMKAVMDQLGNTGNLDFSDETKRELDQIAMGKDEIAQSLRASIMTIHHMEKASGVLQRVADGDLTADFALLSEKDTIGVSIQKMVHNLNIMFGEIRTASGQVSAGSGQVSMAAQGLASGSSQQAASIEEFTASLIELQKKTDHNAENSLKAREANNKTTQRLEDSIHSMDEMLNAMKAIDESSSNITKVIKVIDDIAFQTNILALNAAVEAARAGQHGKGFAVVADEVRNLASKSAAAAKETASLIEGSSEQVREGNQIVAKTNTELKAAAEESRESTLLIEQVAGESNEQAKAILEINQGIEQISVVVQANSATAEQSAAASEEMSAQAVVLDEIVARFKIRAGSGAPASILQQTDTQPVSSGFSLTADKY